MAGVASPRISCADQVFEYAPSYLAARTCLRATPAGFIGCFFRTTCTHAGNKAGMALEDSGQSLKCLQNPAARGDLSGGLGSRSSGRKDSA